MLAFVSIVSGRSAWVKIEDSSFGALPIILLRTDSAGWKLILPLPLQVQLLRNLNLGVALKLTL